MRVLLESRGPRQIPQGALPSQLSREHLEFMESLLHPNSSSEPLTLCCRHLEIQEASQTNMPNTEPLTFPQSVSSHAFTRRPSDNAILPVSQSQTLSIIIVFHLLCPVQFIRKAC